MVLVNQHSMFLACLTHNVKTCPLATGQAHKRMSPTTCGVVKTFMFVVWAEAMQVAVSAVNLMHAKPSVGATPLKTELHPSITVVVGVSITLLVEGIA